MSDTGSQGEKPMAVEIIGPHRKSTAILLSGCDVPVISTYTHRILLFS